MLKKKYFLLVIFKILFLGTISSSALATNVSLDLPIMSQYACRGIVWNDELVMQPSLTVEWDTGLSFNLWGNMDLTGYGNTSKPNAGYGDRTGEFTELDLTLDYTKSFGFLSASLGIVSYVFPGIGATTHEVYGSVSADIITSPALTIYSDVDEVKGSYFLFGLSHTFEITTEFFKGIDIGSSLGYGSGTYNRSAFGINKAALINLDFNLGFNFEVGKIGITPMCSYSRLLDSELTDKLAKKEQENIFYMGINVSL